MPSRSVLVDGSRNRGCPPSKDLARLFVHGEEGLDAHLLQGGVLRHAEDRQGREQFERDLAFREPHRQNGRSYGLGGRRCETFLDTRVAQQPVAQGRSFLRRFGSGVSLDASHKVGNDLLPIRQVTPQ